MNPRAHDPAFEPDDEDPDSLMLVRKHDVVNLVRLLGGIPAGQGSSQRLTVRSTPSLGQAVVDLERDLEGVRRVCTSYEKDRTALHQIHNDFAAAGRLFKFMGLGS